jgi:hypothetical protein
MEHYELAQDIKVYCVRSESFPEGVLTAHQELHKLVPYSSDRKYFGLSRPKMGIINYSAAAEELHEGELSSLKLQDHIIPKGKYHSITIHNFMEDISAIGKAFEQLVSMPDIDPDGYCVEWYLSDKDVRCMVKIR